MVDLYGLKYLYIQQKINHISAKTRISSTGGGGGGGCQKMNFPTSRL